MDVRSQYRRANDLIWSLNDELSLMRALKRIWKEEVIKGMDISGKWARTKHGFFQRRLWQANPVSFSDKVMEFSDKGNMLDTIFVDSKKAFDMVSHEELISDAKENKDYRRIIREGRNCIDKTARGCVEREKSGKKLQELLRGLSLSTILFNIFIEGLNTNMSGANYTCWGSIVNTAKIRKMGRGIQS